MKSYVLIMTLLFSCNSIKIPYENNLGKMQIVNDFVWNNNEKDMRMGRSICTLNVENQSKKLNLKSTCSSGFVVENVEISINEDLNITYAEYYPQSCTIDYNSYQVKEIDLVVSKNPFTVDHFQGYYKMRVKVNGFRKNKKDSTYFITIYNEIDK